MTHNAILRRTVLPLVGGLLLAIVMTIVLAQGWMGAPAKDTLDLVQYLCISGLISSVGGLAAVFWLRRGRVRLWLQLTATFLLGVAVAMFNIFMTANLMFLSEHDLPLLMVLLTFAAIISLGLAYALARVLAQRVTAVYEGAQALAAGNLQARVPEQGDDELGQLARAFNHMADQLAASAAERERLERARRNLVVAVSHDLRTPLTSLQVMTEAMDDGLVTDEQTRARYFSTMRGQIGQLSRLIDELFEIAQIDAGALQLKLLRVAPGELASDAAEGLRASAEAKDVALHVQIEPALPAILAAPQHIERVLNNLLTNALRHTSAGGRIDLRVVSQSYGGGEKQVLFEVADTGEGIRAEDLPYIFEPFFRGEQSRSRSTGGTGLGLAIAQSIVKAHHGRIWAESVPQQGTTVGFSVPVAYSLEQND